MWGVFSVLQAVFYVDQSSVSLLEGSIFVRLSIFQCLKLLHDSISSVKFFCLHVSEVILALYQISAILNVFPYFLNYFLILWITLYSSVRLYHYLEHQILFCVFKPAQNLSSFPDLLYHILASCLATTWSPWVGLGHKCGKGSMFT